MPSRPAVPEMLTMLPRFCSIMTLRAALQHRKMALRLTLRTASHSSSVISCTWTMGPRKPTLLTRMSRLPHLATTSATIRSTCARSVASHVMATAAPPFCWMAWTTPSRSVFVRSRSTRAIFAPLACEGVGDGFADAACAADDDGYLICQFHGSSQRPHPLDSGFRRNDGCGVQRCFIRDDGFEGLKVPIHAACIKPPPAPSPRR